jgi:hypothetical protein
MSELQAAIDNEKASELRSQLATEKAAHEQTLRALEKARNTQVKPLKREKITTPKGDLVEIITGDWHGNKHEPDAFAAFEADLKFLNPDRVFLGGDIIDCGGFLAEHHTPGYVAESEDSYEDDVLVTNQLLNRLQKVAPNAEIHYLEGNHEWRVERWAVTQKIRNQRDVDMLRKAFCAQHVLNLENRGIHYYRQGQHHGDCSVPGWVRMDKLFYVHKISNASDAAHQALNKTAANLVYFDTHRASYKPRFLPGTGLISAWNPGCLCKRQPLYAHTRPTEWTHGYLVRFISRATGFFQMVNVTINGNQSFGKVMFGER